MPFVNKNGQQSTILLMKNDETEADAIERLTAEGWTITDYEIEGNRIVQKTKSRFSNKEDKNDSDPYAEIA